MDWFERLCKEYAELTVATGKLEGYLSSPSASNTAHKNLLVAQFHAMKSYEQILGLRVELELKLRGK